jgi:undecaprenyl-diphosphatase
VTVIQAILLGCLQGATEFLPVSSSGHLVLVPWLLGWAEPGLAFSAVVHWATALAVLGYFWREWLSLLRAAARALVALTSWVSRAVAGRERSGRLQTSSELRLLGLLVLGSIPAAVVGYFLEDFFERMFGRPVVAAVFLLVTAVILALSERFARRERDLGDMSWLDAVLVGFGQALAIFPGLSRSGATIGAGMARGLRREWAARFSFLLATPVIVGAGLFKLVDLMQAGGLSAQAPMLAAGFLAAGLVGLACIHLLLRYVQRRPLYPFAIYCSLAGLALLALALFRGV